MNRQSCEREDRTVAAVLSGTLDREIAMHAQQCLACLDILLVAGFLQSNNAVADHERTALPAPGLIWRRARVRANQDALRLALRPIRFMKIMACVAFAFSPWLRLLLPIGRELSVSWSSVFDSNLLFLSKTSLGFTAQVTMFFGFAGTLILLGLSSWYMLRQE